MTHRNVHGTAIDMYARTFPGDPYVLTFEPSEEQVATVTAHTVKYATDDTEQEALLRMLGIIPTESAAAVAIRVNRTRSMFCRNGHKRSVHSTTRKDGYMRCTKCAAEAREKHAA